LAELVSILIPAYRAEEYISETIRCALDQTWSRKEVIVVDDGSPDRTYRVARKWERNNVKIVSQENQGAPAARNKALSLAQGEYIQWLDADDLLHPEKLRLQLDGAEGGLTSRTLITCAWGRFFSSVDRASFEPDALWQDLDPIEWILTKFGKNVWMNPAVWLVSRKLTELAGQWDPRLAKSGDDDGEYVCRLVAASDRVRFVREARSYYRIGMVGSLNWNMGIKEDTMLPLILALTTSIQHLLVLEDSARTRDASRCFLESFLPYFYGSDERYYDLMEDFAQKQLGQGLNRPSVSWKYRPFELVAGKAFTRRLMLNWRTAKTSVRRSYEENMRNTAWKKN